MIDLDGTNLLSRGREKVLGKDYASALRDFQEALQVHAYEGGLIFHPQYLSHYGVALAIAGSRREEGLRLCERSIQLEPYEPEHFLNLARIHLERNDRQSALLALDRGLAALPENPAIRQERNRIERRRCLPFPSLPRDHVLNRCFVKFFKPPAGRPEI